MAFLRVSFFAVLTVAIIREVVVRSPLPPLDLSASAHLNLHCKKMQGWIQFYIFVLLKSLNLLKPNKD